MQRPSPTDTTGSGDDGTVDDQFRALLEGLRTSIPGVQVLFAFLLTAPLQSSFADLAAQEKTAFLIAFYAAGIASLLLIAPSVHQRVRAPSTGIARQSARHLRWTTWVGIFGSIAMGVAMVATTYLVSRLVLPASPAILATAMVAALMSWAWFYLPLVTFHRRD